MTRPRLHFAFIPTIENLSARTVERSGIQNPKLWAFDNRFRVRVDWYCGSGAGKTRKFRESYLAVPLLRL